LEPISPELVLVSPELRELALASAPPFPAPRPKRPSRRRRAVRRLVFAAAVVFVLAALAVAPGFTGGERPQLEPSRPRPAVALERGLEAERDVLRSPRFFLQLGRAGTAFVDPATKLFRAGTTITCALTERRHNGSWERVCRASRGRASIRIRYVQTGRSSFRLATP
jgi:hypothetical protein